MKQFKYIKTSLLITSVLVFASSCIKNNIQELRDEEIGKINKFIEGKNFTDIGDGVYLKFYNRTDVAPQDGAVEDFNSFVINYDALYIDNEIIETTDSAKGHKLFPGRRIVYGPTKFKSGYLSMAGFELAIKHFSTGDTGTIVIPSWYALGGGVSRVFHVGMKEVIENDSIREIEKLVDFLEVNEFSADKMVYNGVYYKSPGNPSFTLPDTSLYETLPTVDYSVTARYAELYYPSGLGRQFFPLLDDTIANRTINDRLEFPLRYAVDSTLLKMKNGDVVDICLSSTLGYGANGYYHPTLNVQLVPPYTSLFYRIKFDSVITTK